MKSPEQITHYLEMILDLIRGLTEQSEAQPSDEHHLTLTLLYGGMIATAWVMDCESAVAEGIVAQMRDSGMDLSAFQKVMMQPKPHELN